MPRTRRVAQDDARENHLVALFNLTRPKNRTRHGTDAILSIDGATIEFEIKSVTTGTKNISTARDVGPDHIAKWRGKHWVIGIFDELDLLSCRYATPDAMKPWIDALWEYIRPDFEMASLVPDLITAEVMFSIIGKKDLYTLTDARKLHKRQYKAAQYRVLMDRSDGYSYSRMLEIFRDRARYIIKRGSTLNNPHIRATYLAELPLIELDHASVLRELVRSWLSGALQLPTAPTDNLLAEPQRSQ